MPKTFSAILPQITEKNGIALFIGECASLCKQIKEKGFKTDELTTGAEALKWLKGKDFKSISPPDLIVINTVIPGLRPFDFIKSLNAINFLRNVPVIFISNLYCPEERDQAIHVGASDYFTIDITPEDLIQRMTFLTRLKELNESIDENDEEEPSDYITEGHKIWGMKRMFDLLFATILLIVLSPVMFLIAIAIKLDSPGPILYVSKRAGKGYQIFDFYKFRTMKAGAESEMENLQHLNVYHSDSSIENPSLFFKAKNDPRTTRLGSFLRRMSLDEFPQLINVIKGDMSMVGNRPLPLYEAEKLTQDQWAKRFAAPAGITGLWQIKKNEKLSEQERLEMDIDYAEDNSFYYDLKIILKTPLVLFQKVEK